MAKILVVDDDELSRSMLELMLHNQGHDLLTASNGADALTCARQELPDLMITDALMPVMDGFELCRRCKHDPALKNMPVILYSANYRDLQEQQLGLDLGAVRYLLKPATPEQIAATVETALRESKTGKPTTDESSLEEQMLLLRSHNEVLFNKLEAKMQELQHTITEQQKTEETMKTMQAQIIQQEKMASIGQLAAGVAHEINNPMGFITSNLTSLGKYAERLDSYIAALQASLAACPGHPGMEELDRLRQQLKVDYIVSDLTQLVHESLEGASRVRRIVQDLKSFSRVDQAEMTRTDLNKSLETTINIAWNELKYIATLERRFGDIPELVCNPQQLNQVFLNLLVNAAQSMDDPGTITVSSWYEEGYICVSVADTGRGMPEEVCARVFEPFYTTKQAGKGTGLGLSISADIVRKHKGEINVESEPGKGTVFTVRLPTEDNS